MILRVDPRSAVPPYEQLRLQIVDLVRDGTLTAGTRLPTIRQLAGDLGLAGGTVARAYRELESAGVVATRGRHGTVIVGPPAGAPAHHPDVVAAARRLVEVARTHDTVLDDATAVVRSLWGTP